MSRRYLATAREGQSSGKTGAWRWKRRDYKWAERIDMSSIAVRLHGVVDETARDSDRSAEVIEAFAAMARLASKRGPLKKQNEEALDAAA